MSCFIFVVIELVVVVVVVVVAIILKKACLKISIYIGLN